jgi:hypothetical protein
MLLEHGEYILFGVNLRSERTDHGFSQLQEASN